MSSTNSKMSQFLLTSFFPIDVMIGGKNRAFATRRDAAKLYRVRPFAILYLYLCILSR